MVNIMSVSNEKRCKIETFLARLHMKQPNQNNQYIQNEQLRRI